MPIHPLDGRPLPPVVPDPGPRAERTEPRGPAHARGAFADMVHALGREADRGEATVQRVLGNGAANLGPSELLALQAGIYRYGETVDLAAKLVDKAGTNVQHVLQGQS